MKRLLLIDSNSLIHRAFHALPPLTGPSGEPTGALYGFSSMLLKALRDIEPDYVAACFDLPGPTFRHETFKEYKAQRPETPEALSRQLEKAKKILGAFGIAVLAIPGYEADDLIGTIAETAKKESEVETIILTGDLDMLQLATDQVKIHTMRKGISDIVMYDKKAVEERYGFKPEFLPDYKALRGDPSDNIPGVPGIGEKTATSIVAAFGTLDEIYKEVEKTTAPKLPLTENLKTKLIERKQNAFLSKDLATIRRSAPIAPSFAEYSFRGASKETVEPIFRELGFKTLIKRLRE